MGSGTSPESGDVTAAVSGRSAGTSTPVLPVTRGQSDEGGMPPISGRVQIEKHFDGPCPEGELVGWYYEDPFDNPLDPTNDILHLIVKCPNEIAGDGGGGGLTGSGGGGGGWYDPFEEDDDKEDDKDDCDKLPIDLRTTIRPMKGLCPTSEQWAQITNFLTKELLSTPCMLDFPDVKKCLEQLLLKGPPLLYVGVADRDDAGNINNATWVRASTVLDNTGHASKGSDYGVGVSHVTFGKSRNEQWKAVLFHELLHHCSPELDEIEIEILEQICFPKSDVIETTELNFIQAALYHEAWFGTPTYGPNNLRKPVLYAFDLSDGTRAILLVYPNFIIDPVTGDVWKNIGSARFPIPGKKVVNDKFRFSSQSVSRFLRQAEAYKSYADSERDRAERQLKNLYGKTGKRDDIENRAVGMSFIRRGTTIA